MRSNRTSLLDHLVGLASGLAVLVGAAATHADIIESFWIPSGGDFEEPANWNGPVPDETVTAISRSVKEMAKALNRSEKATESLLARAREAFRGQFLEVAGEEEDVT